MFIFSHTSPALLYLFIYLFIDDDWHSDVGGVDFQCSFYLNFLDGLAF